MWIRGNILLTQPMSEQELANQFPEPEREIEEDKLIITTQKIPFFAEHKLHLKIHGNKVNYRLSVPSLGPLIFFMYLAVIFLAGFTTWRMLVVGSIVVTGIAFAIYVINDKGARNYLHKHVDHVKPENEQIAYATEATEQCPACNTSVSHYTKICPGCGLHFKKAKKIKSRGNHTASRSTNIQYHLKK